MKKIILFCLLLSATSLFAQRTYEQASIPSNQPIELKGNKFYVGGEEYSSYDIKNHLQNNNLEAYTIFKKNKTKSSFGGLLLGLGCGLIVGDVVKGLVSDVDYPGGFTYVGAGLAAASIPVLSGRKKLVQQSIDTYNNGLSKEKTLGFNYDVEVVSNQNGIGLNIRF